jgi:phage tail sheath protein FI
MAPGVVITTGTAAGPAAPGQAPAATYFVVGQAERGPIDRAVLVTSFAEFVHWFGDATSYSTLWDNVRAYFEEGGSRAYVARVVGGAATSGALSTPLQDRGTTPAATLAVAAASPGAWSNRVKVKVLDGSTAATFRLQVLVDNEVTEEWAALRSPADAVSRINDGREQSSYIRVTSAGSAAVAPANNPVAVGPLTLTAGNDDRGAIVTAGYTAALDLFNEGLGDGCVAIPGLGSAVHAALIAHADTYNRIALLAAERGADKATLLGYAAPLDAPRAGLFAPWVKVPDGSGGSKVISPESYVAGARARAHESTGPWRAAAGEIAQARWVISPDQTFTPTDAGDLDAGKVNPLLTIAATTRVYGWRSLAVDQLNWKMLSYADVVNRIVVECRRLLEPYVFQAVDGKGHLLSAIAGTLEGVVKPFADAGGLFPWVETDAAGTPTTVDPGYKVSTGSELNTRVSLGNDEVRALVVVRPAPTAAQVILTINKASVTAAL